MLCAASVFVICGLTSHSNGEKETLCPAPSLDEGWSPHGYLDTKTDFDGDGQSDSLRMYCTERVDDEVLSSCVRFLVDLNGSQLAFSEDQPKGEVDLSQTEEPFRLEVLGRGKERRGNYLLLSWGLMHGENESPFEVRARHRVVLSYDKGQLRQLWYQLFDGGLTIGGDGKVRVTKYDCEQSEDESPNPHFEIKEVWTRTATDFSLESTRKNTTSSKSLGVDLCDY